MKAIICPKYGPPEVLQIKEVEKPAPGDNEVLIKVYATTVTVGDSRVRGFRVPFSFWVPARILMGIRKPKKPILGMEVSGVIEAIGKGVTLFKKGDPVFANAGHSRFGAYAEYCCLPENGSIALKPENLSYEESASLTFGGITALHFLREGNVRTGDKVLIYGASGSVGTAAVQLAKYFGADVTGVCSTANLDMVKFLGADKVVDYTKSDFSKTGEQYDVIFDTVGKASISKIIKSLKPEGKFIHAVTTPGVELRIKLSLIFSKKKLIGGTYKILPEQINFLRKLAMESKIKPVIDRIFPFEQMIEAHRYVDLGHKRGNVVIKLMEDVAFK